MTCFQDYLLTFNMNCGNCACRNFTGEEADSYCRSMGARAVSLDTKQKWEHFKSVMNQNRTQDNLGLELSFNNSRLPSNSPRGTSGAAAA